MARKKGSEVMPATNATRRVAVPPDPEPESDGVDAWVEEGATAEFPAHPEAAASANAVKKVAATH